MNLQNNISIPATVFAQIVDNEMVILDTKNENYFGLDPIGTVMWEQLTQTGSIEKLYTYMLEHYDVEEIILKKDIEIFIQNLVKNRLIKLEE